MSTKKPEAPKVVYTSKEGHERVVYDAGTIHVERAFKDAMGGVSWVRAGDFTDRERILKNTVAHLVAEAERLRNG